METTEVRRLVRRRDDRIIAGVCGGIADHFGIDVTLVRIGVVALTIFGGAGVLLYAVAWVVIPEEGRRHGYADTWVHRRSWQSIVGVVLVAIAVASLSDRIWPFGDVGFPLFLIGLGAFLLWFRPSEVPRGAIPPPPAMPMPPVTEPATEAVTEAVTEPMAAPFAEPVTTPFTMPIPPVPPIPPIPPIPPVPPTATSAREWHQQFHRQQRAAAQQWRLEQQANVRRWRHEQRMRRHQRRSLTVPTLGVLAIGAGGFGVALSAGASIDASRAIGGALAIVGVALVVAAWYGRAGGLVPVGLLLLAALTVVSAISVPFRGGVGQRTYRPATIGELDDEYHVAVGELVLRLRQLSVPDGTTHHVTATVGMGHLLVEVPPDVEVVVHGSTDMGDVQIAGADDSGWRVDKTSAIHAGHEGAGRIEIDAQVGFGMVEVRGA